MLFVWCNHAPLGFAVLSSPQPWHYCYRPKMLWHEASPAYWPRNDWHKHLKAIGHPLLYTCHYSVCVKIGLNYAWRKSDLGILHLPTGLSYIFYISCCFIITCHFTITCHFIFCSSVLYTLSYFYCSYCVLCTILLCFFVLSCIILFSYVLLHCCLERNGQNNNLIVPSTYENKDLESRILVFTHFLQGPCILHYSIITLTIC